MKDLTPRREDLDPIEIASRDEIAGVQLQRLKKTLADAARVPHYKAAFEAAGVSPDDLTSLDDLAKFPFTVKSDLRYPSRSADSPILKLSRSKPDGDRQPAGSLRYRSPRAVGIGDVSSARS